MKKLIILLLIFTNLLYSIQNPKKKILFISSYHSSFPTVEKQYNGIMQSLDKEHYQIDIEYMDTKRLSYAKEEAHLLEHFLGKIEFLKEYDGILLGDDNALHFALRYQNILFKNKPMVFFAINDENFAKLASKNPFITGVIERPSIEETIKVIHTLHPKKKIKIIRDNTPTSIGIMKSLEAFIDDTMEVINLADYSYDTLLSTLTSDEPILYISAFEDKNKHRKDFYDSLDFLKESKAPIYHLYEHGIGSGMIGGKVVMFSEQGKLAANTLKNVLHGKNIKDIPYIKESPNIFLFDIDLVRDFGIDAKLLPKNSYFHNMKSKYTVQTSLSLTKKEKEYLKKKKTFKVCDRYNHYPLSGYKDGELTGIAGDVFKLIAQKLNIDFTIIPANSNNEFVSNIKNNKCDLVSVIKQGFSSFDNIKTTISTTVHQQFVALGDIQLAYNEELDKDTKAIFYVKGFVHKEVILKRYPNLHVIVESNQDKIMEIIKDNHHTYFVLPNIVADNVIQKYGSNTYKVVNRFEKLQAISSIGVNTNTAPQMIDILNKTVHSIGESTLNEIVENYRLKEYTIETSYQWLWYLVALLVLSIIVIQYSFIQKMKENEIRNKKNLKDIEYLNESLSQQTVELEDLYANQYSINEELNLEKTRFQLAIEGAQNGIFDWNIETNEIYFSPRWKEIIGYQDDELENSFDTWLNLLHPHDIKIAKERIDEYFHSDTQIYDVDFRMKHKNGSWVWINARGKADRDENGNPIRMVGFHTNITELVDYREELEGKVLEQTTDLLSLTEKFKEAQKIAQIGSWTLDIANDKLLWSDEIFNIFEIDQNHFEASYEAFIETIHPDDRKMVNEAYLQSLKDQKNYKVIHRLLMSDGRIKWVEEQCTNDFDKNNNPIFSSGTVQDITEKKLAEDKIVETNRILKLSQSLAKIGSWRINFGDTIVIGSDEFNELYGVQHHPYSFNDLLQTIHPDDREETANILTKVMQTPYEGSTEYRIIVNGNIKELLINWELEYDTRGDVVAFIGYSQDITEQKAKDVLLVEQAKMAALGDMLGNIAHQWRQPLSTISTSAGILAIKYETKTLTDEDVSKFEKNILEYTQYLSKTIDTFRNFIKGDNQKELTSICEVIDEGISLIRDTFTNHYITIEDQVHDSEICGQKVLIARHEFAQVIINILNNAKDAILENNIENGWVKIKHSHNEDNIIITIEDNGGGIPKDVLPKIFEPYFTTKHQAQGTGLGLHMSYKIITESMNGKIYASNTKNGALFTIEIPLDK